MGRGRYRGKLRAKDSNRTTRRRKAMAVLDRMAQCFAALGDPRDQMSLEEKKRHALFYYFHQVVFGQRKLVCTIFELPFAEVPFWQNQVCCS